MSNVKVDNPQGLNCRFEGPYQIISRPSRSTVEVRIGSFVDGKPRLQTYNWSSCKIAHLREGAPEGQRPKLGRKKTSASSDVPDSTDAKTNFPVAVTPPPVETSVTTDVPQQLEQPSKSVSGRPVRTTRNPHPQYIDSIRFFQYDGSARIL